MPQFVYLFFLLPIVLSMEGILFTTVSVHLNTPEPRCNETVLELDGTNHKPFCTGSTDSHTLIFVFNGTNVVDNTNKNITLTLKILTGEATNYTGILAPDRKDPNTVKMGQVTMEPVYPTTTPGPSTTTVTTKTPTTVETSTPKPSPTSPPPTTTATPKKEAHLQIAYIFMQNNVQNVTKNGSAVAVAVIEGLALIAILVYFGYKTMVAQKTPQNNSLYGYDNNNAPRITIPDSIRMSDIPPPRDPAYATPPTPTPLAPTPQRTMMASPELMVPSTVTPQNPPNNAGQFNDPFASLDSW